VACSLFDLNGYSRYLVANVVAASQFSPDVRTPSGRFSEDQTTFWVFDPFPSAADLKVHAAAPFAEALRQDADRWFVTKPEVSVSTVLGAKVPAQA